MRPMLGRKVVKGEQDFFVFRKRPESPKSEQITWLWLFQSPRICSNEHYECRLRLKPSRTSSMNWNPPGSPDYERGRFCSGSVRFYATSATFQSSGQPKKLLMLKAQSWN